MRSEFGAERDRLKRDLERRLRTRASQRGSSEYYDNSHVRLSQEKQNEDEKSEESDLSTAKSASKGRDDHRFRQFH